MDKLIKKYLTKEEIAEFESKAKVFYDNMAREILKYGQKLRSERGGDGPLWEITTEQERNDFYNRFKGKDPFYQCEELALTRYCEYLQKNKGTIKNKVLADIDEWIQDATRENFLKECEEARNDPFKDTEENAQEDIYQDEPWCFMLYLKDFVEPQLRACNKMGIDIEFIKMYLYKKAGEVYNIPPQEIENEIRESIQTLKKSGEIDEDEPIEGQISLAFEDKKTPQGVTVKRLKELTYLRDKTTSTIFKGAVEYNAPKEKTLYMGKKGGKSVINKISLKIIPLDDKEIKIPNILNDIDKLVYIVICSYVDAGEKRITPQMVYKTIAGSGNKRITESWENLIEETFFKLRTVLLRVDATEEAKAFNTLYELGYTPTESKDYKFYIEDNLLHAKKTIEVINGQPVPAYYIIEPPILLTYATARNHITRVPVGVLSTDFDKTPGFVSLESFLMEEIIRTKGQHTNNTITFSSIYERVGAKDKTSKDRVRKKVLSLLETYKANEVIKDYACKGKGEKNKYYSIEIF